MNKWIINLLKDRFVFIIGFFLNSFFVIAFFYLNDGKREIFYPLIISLFIFGIILVFEIIKYIPFNRNLSHSIKNVSYDLNPGTEEQKKVDHTIKEIHKFYLEKLYAMDSMVTEKEHFYSHWTHNIKTPVSVIDLIIQKAESGQIDLLQGMNEIKLENNRIHRILEQILNVIRLEDFSKDYTPEAINLIDTLKVIINNRKNLFIYNHVYPKLETSRDNIEVLSDKKWNAIMLEQFISNAVKYSKLGNESKYIFINITQETDRTILTIRDEGIGIPVHDLHKIFDPFFTGENGRKVQDATGIGLYICSKIATKLGHDINITSGIGKGTTVSITYLTKT